MYSKFKRNNKKSTIIRYYYRHSIVFKCTYLKIYANIAVMRRKISLKIRMNLNFYQLYRRGFSSERIVEIIGSRGYLAYFAVGILE